MELSGVTGIRSPILPQADTLITTIVSTIIAIILFILFQPLFLCKTIFYSNSLSSNANEERLTLYAPKLFRCEFSTWQSINL